MVIRFYTNILASSDYASGATGELLYESTYIRTPDTNAMRAKYEQYKALEEAGASPFTAFFGASTAHVLLGLVRPPVCLYVDVSDYANPLPIYCGNDDSDWWMEHIFKWVDIANQLGEGEEVSFIEPVKSSNEVMPGVPVKISVSSWGTLICVYAMQDADEYSFYNCDQYTMDEDAVYTRVGSLTATGMSEGDAYKLIHFAFMLKTALAMGLDEQAVIDFDREMYAKCQMFAEELGL